MIFKEPVEVGANPVIPVGSELYVQLITSVVRAPVAVVVTTVAQVPEDIALVPNVEVPLVTPKDRVPPENPNPQDKTTPLIVFYALL